MKFQIYFKRALSISQSPIGLVGADSEEEAGRKLGLYIHPEDTECNWHSPLLGVGDAGIDIAEMHPSFLLVEVKEISSPDQLKDELINLGIIKEEDQG